jgi:hypothetical protein
MAGKLVLAVAAALTLAAQPVAGAGTGLEIVTSGPRKQHRIGSYFVAREPGRSYPAAVRAFGQPSAHAAGEPGSCVARWPSLGLQMTFSSAAPAPCSPTSLGRAVWFGATVSGVRWRTDRGLRIGDSLATLRRLYPQAYLRKQPSLPAAWILVWIRGEVGPTVYLQAAVRSGRVAAFELPPGYVSAAH